MMKANFPSQKAQKVGVALGMMMVKNEKKKKQRYLTLAATNPVL